MSNRLRNLERQLESDPENKALQERYRNELLRNNIKPTDDGIYVELILIPNFNPNRMFPSPVYGVDTYASKLGKEWLEIEKSGSYKDLLKTPNRSDIGKIISMKSKNYRGKKLEGKYYRYNKKGDFCVVHSGDQLDHPDDWDGSFTSLTDMRKEVKPGDILDVSVYNSWDELLDDFGIYIPKKVPKNFGKKKKRW